MNIKTFVRAAMTRLAILAGVLAGLIVFINLPWFDEELHEDLAGLARPRDVSLEGNAYPLIVGMRAPRDQDPREAGLRFIQAQREHFRTHGHTTMLPDQATPLPPHAIPIPSLSRLFNGYTCNPRVDLDCVDRLNAAVIATPVTDADVRLLLDRFERILGEPRFEETQEFDLQTLPDYGPLVVASRIRLAESFRDTDSSRILLAIGEDSRLWKRMLEGGGTLIAKMVALAGLRNDTMAISTLLRTRQLGASELQQIPALLSQLTERERNIEETFMAETRLAMLNEAGFRAVSGSHLLLRLISQDNATLNEYYMALMVPLRLRATLSAGEFYRQKAYEPLSYPMRLMPPPLYNLGGRQYVSITAQLNNWQYYIARVHDVDGRIALALLQAEIALNADKDVGEVVRSSRYRNPYTGEPMDYDAAAGTIGFKCLGTADEVCALRIDTSRPPPQPPGSTGLPPATR